MWLHERTAGQRMLSQADGLSQLAVMRLPPFGSNRVSSLMLKEHMKQTLHRQAKQKHYSACQSDRPLPWKAPLPGHCRCAADLLLHWLPLWAPQRWSVLRCAAACVESSRQKTTWSVHASHRPRRLQGPVAGSQARIAKAERAMAPASSLRMAAAALGMPTAAGFAASATPLPCLRPWAVHTGARCCCAA